MKLKTITLLQNGFSKIITITSAQQSFTSVKKEQFDILTRLVQKPCKTESINNNINHFFKGM